MAIHAAFEGIGLQGVLAIQESDDIQPFSSAR
jgi:hypothetical protein